LYELTGLSGLGGEVHNSNEFWGRSTCNNAYSNFPYGNILEFRCPIVHSLACEHRQLTNLTGFIVMPTGYPGEIGDAMNVEL